MDRNEAIERAKQFAQIAYAAASNEILPKGQDEIAKMRANLAARGIAISGANIDGTARILGEQLRALAQAHLDAILEGYELHSVEITDQLAREICDQVIAAANTRLSGAGRSQRFQGMPAQASSVFPQLLERHSGISGAWVKTQIDRRRLTVTKNSGQTTIYYLQGENPRVNLNSTDHSINVVTKPAEEIFGGIRQRIESEVPEGNKRRQILDALTAMQETGSTPSFAQRYTEFIAITADYVTLLTPFMPALAQMLAHALGR